MLGEEETKRSFSTFSMVYESWYYWLTLFLRHYLSTFERLVLTHGTTDAHQAAYTSDLLQRHLSWALWQLDSSKSMFFLKLLKNKKKQSGKHLNQTNNSTICLFKEYILVSFVVTLYLTRSDCSRNNAWFLQAVFMSNCTWESGQGLCR